jgi:scyllo-inositol 2-dehydrogenase (NADP+)
MKNILQTGIVGFGLSGKMFHAPFIQAHPHLNLHSIVTSGSEAAKIYPDAQIVKDFAALIDDAAIDLVVICTPHQYHTQQACAALEKGKHVVIEKPVAMHSADVATIMAAAKKYGTMVFPYHNRRWDGDFLTLRHLINDGYLGKVLDFESRFDRYNPRLARAEWRYNDESGGGTLYDLGPHLIDQAICLFGAPQAVWCLLHRQRPGSVVGDSFDMKLIYPDVVASLRAGVFIREPGPRFQVHGTAGSYIKYGLGTQEGMLQKGKMPTEANFGEEPKKNYGLLHSVVNQKTIRLKYPTMPGNYLNFYEDVFRAVSAEKQPEVTIEDALLNLRIIEAALKSNEEGRNVQL